MRGVAANQPLHLAGQPLRFFQDAKSMRVARQVNDVVRAMAIAIATACFALALAAAFVGVVIEYPQTRADGPVAIVGKMQSSPAAAIFSVLGLLGMPVSLDWWWYPIVFLVVLLVSGWAIIRASN